jgi:hypothetical protein
LAEMGWGGDIKLVFIWESATIMKNDTFGLPCVKHLKFVNGSY